jgi:hypothetical protein
MSDSRDDINTKDFTIERADKVDEQYDKKSGLAIHLNRLRVRGAMNLRLRAESDAHRIDLGAVKNN